MGQDMAQTALSLLNPKEEGGALPLVPLGSASLISVTGVQVPRPEPYPNGGM